MSLGTAIMVSMPVPASPIMVFSSASKILTFLKPLSLSSWPITLGGSRRVAMVPQFTPSPSTPTPAAATATTTTATQRSAAAIARSG
jgi:hypothetical protein